MADPDTPTGQGDNNNFDNDFEKLDPFHHEAAPAGLDDQFDLGLVSSTTAPETEEDLYSATARAAVEEPEKPLVSFEEEPEPPQPAAEDPFSLPDSTAASAAVTAAAAASSEPEREPSPTPPAPAAEPVTVSEVSPKKKAKQQGPGQPWIKNIDPRDQRSLRQIFQPVLDLIYWRDVKKTGLIFGSVLLLLLSLALFSVLSVVAYLCLAILTVTVSFVLYKKVLGAVQKAGDGHPFKKYLEVEISLPEDRVHQMADHVLQHVTTTAKELRRLFLVEDLIDSMKFGLLLWVLTYIGAWFNGMTLIILAVVTVFTVPKFYETYKVQIDQYLDLARTQLKNILQQVQEKLPFPGKKKQA